MSCIPLHLLALCATPWLSPPCTRIPARGVDDASPWSASFEEALRAGRGHTIAFRHRMIEVGHAPGAPGARLSFDGVEKLTFGDDGIWTEEVGLMKEEAEATAVPRRVSTFYSLVSGDCVRECSRADGDVRTAFVDRWNGPPPIALYALRKMQGPRELDGYKCIDHSLRADGLERYLYANDAGSQTEFFFLPGDPPELCSVRLDVVSSANVVWIHFDGDSGSVAAAAPVMITEVHVDRAGKVSEASVWTEVTGAWASQPIAPEVRPGAALVDLRDRDGIPSAVATDRELALDALATWPSNPRDIVQASSQELAIIKTEGGPSTLLLSLGVVSLAASIAVSRWKSKEVRS